MRGAPFPSLQLKPADGRVSEFGKTASCSDIECKIPLTSTNLHRTVGPSHFRLTTLSVRVLIPCKKE